jgi:hypothetical protein
MDFNEYTAQNCRLIILRGLVDQNDHQLNETLIKHLLETFGHTKSRDYIRTQLRKLNELGAISLAEAGTVLVAQLKQPGLDHVERRAFLDGVGEPSIGT